MDSAGLRVIIPVKMSERLPFKHFLTLGGETLLNIAIGKASKFGEPQVLSRIPVPVPFIKDESRNIVELMNTLTGEGRPFLILAPDMPFITESDISLLLKESSGETLVPVSREGIMEPLFAYYAGRMHFEGNLFSALKNSGIRTIEKERFSDLAFYNVNTPEDYSEAVRLFHSRRRTNLSRSLSL